MFKLRPVFLKRIDLKVIKCGLTLALLGLIMAGRIRSLGHVPAGRCDPGIQRGPSGQRYNAASHRSARSNSGAENAQYPFQTHAYELAAKIPAVLHQQPCYCYCDRGMGHNSLHSCFEGTHGAQCCGLPERGFTTLTPCTRRKRPPPRFVKGS